MKSTTVVELEGVNGEWFNLTTGDRGVFLATDVKGAFYDPPVKVVYEEPGNFPGARYLNHRILRRDITFGVEILNDAAFGERSWLSRDSEWRKAFAFDRDATLHVTTIESGTRSLKIRLGESPEVDMFTDPNGLTMNRTVMVCIAGDPFWYEEDAVYEAVTSKDTRFDPTFWTPPWPWEELPKETLTIDASPGSGSGPANPTDQYIWPAWTFPGSTEPIPEFGWPFPEGVAIPWERAPFTQFTVPDYAFEDEALADRRVKTPGFIYGENAVINSNPAKEQLSTDVDTQAWARMNGVRFRHPIPPYTEGREFQIDAAGCAPGQMITLRLPRPWSRCWGLE